jgi:type II secretory ATPase GspE/PulE/Tfp pilus assembly ATPase PilB-like protein
MTAKKEAKETSHNVPQSLDDIAKLNDRFANLSLGEIIKTLFSNGNKLLTDVNGPLPLTRETKGLLALFSDGSFIVSEANKFDGRVLSFISLAKKRNLIVNPPYYVSPALISSIYKENEKIVISSEAKKSTFVQDDSNNQMQRDFVEVIAKAASVKTSDVHIVVSDQTTIYFRMDGVMQKVLEYDVEWGEALMRTAFAASDISDSNYTQNEYQAAQKLGDTPLRGSSGEIRLPNNILAIRLQFNPIAFGTRYLIMRLLYASTGDKKSSGDLTALGYGKYEDELFFRMRAAPTGLCVVSGPTGSGKSTTLQRNMISMLQERNFEINLITVEDPPEYPIVGARQMPVTNATTEEEKAEAFNKALSAALRSDPDALMVGEVRALAAAQLTFKGALSGHNVWTTLHANSAAAVISRFRDMGVETFKLKDPDLIKGLIAQRLFRRVCPNCREPLKDHPEHPSYKRVLQSLGEIGIEHTYIKGAGCEKCGGRGAAGRIVIGEIIMPDLQFLEFMVDGYTKKALDYWINDLGGRSMKDSAIEKMFKGVIDVDEVERWCGLLD